MKLRHVFLLAFLLAALPAFGQLVLVGGCAASATSCTPATVGGHTFASGQFIYTFAFRTATIAPTVSSSPTFIGLDTASASSSSFRSGCAVSTSGSPSSGTWANATRVVTLIYSGSPATSTVVCASSGVGGKTASGTSGTTSTITYTGITLTHGDGSSWVIGAAGGSAAVCTPATVLYAEESGTDLVGNDTNGGVTSFSTLTCTGSTGNWKSDTVELLSTTLAAPTFTPDAGGFTTVGGVYVTINLPGGATGCYTTDNSTPTASPDGTCSHGSTYSAPVLISTSSTVLQAIATESGFVNSAVKNSTYTLTTPFSMLSLMGAGIGGFAGALSVTGSSVWLAGTSASPSGGGPEVAQCVEGGTAGTLCTVQIPATTAGSTRIIGLVDENNEAVYISSAYDCTTSTGCTSGNQADTAILCASHTCAHQTADDIIDLSVIYNGAASQTYVTFNLSTTPANTSYWLEYVEILPPLCNGVRCTLSFGSYQSFFTASCGTCSATNMTLSSDTEEIVYIVDPSGYLAGVSNPYHADFIGNMFSLDTSSGTGASITSSGWWSQGQIAFKVNGGTSYSAATPIFTSVNGAPPSQNAWFPQGTTQQCNPTCTITLNANATAGNGGYLGVMDQGGQGRFISSVTNGGTWTTGASAQLNLSGANAMSYAYNLSLTSTGTYSVTMSGNCTSCQFVYYEWHAHIGLEQRRCSELRDPGQYDEGPRRKHREHYRPGHRFSVVYLDLDFPF